MKKANISELKARLSAYVAEVRKGETVIVLDRRNPVARLIPFEHHPGALQIDEPSRPASELQRIRPVPLRKKVDIDRLLWETRQER